jgi:hypothetical protein
LKSLLRLSIIENKNNGWRYSITICKNYLLCMLILIFWRESCLEKKFMKYQEYRYHCQMSNFSFDIFSGVLMSEISIAKFRKKSTFPDYKWSLIRTSFLTFSENEVRFSSRSRPFWVQFFWMISHSKERKILNRVHYIADIYKLWN